MRLGLSILLLVVLVGQIINAAPSEKHVKNQIKNVDKNHLKTDTHQQKSSKKNEFTFAAGKLETKHSQKSDLKKKNKTGKKAQSKKGNSKMIHGASNDFNPKSNDGTEEKLMKMLHSGNDESKMSFPKTEAKPAFLEQHKDWMSDNGEARSMMDALSHDKHYNGPKAMHMHQKDEDEHHDGKRHHGKSKGHHFNVLNHHSPRYQHNTEQDTYGELSEEHTHPRREHRPHSLHMLKLRKHFNKGIEKPEYFENENMYGREQLHQYRPQFGQMRPRLSHYPMEGRKQLEMRPKWQRAADDDEEVNDKRTRYNNDEKDDDSYENRGATKLGHRMSMRPEYSSKMRSMPFEDIQKPRFGHSQRMARPKALMSYE